MDDEPVEEPGVLDGNRPDVTHQVLQAAPVTASLVLGGAVL